MPKIRYINKRFHNSSLIVIEQVNKLIEEYVAQGFDMTLRQIYYQLVSQGKLSNTQQSYDRLGTIVSDGRLAGLIDWNAVKDRTRFLRSRPNWDSPVEIVRGAAHQYHRDWWAGQEFRPEVWIEKDALIGVIEGVCSELDVPCFSCRGYVSQSAMWRASERLSGYDGTPFLIHLGDHDPSGIDMSRDIGDRLSIFGSKLKFERIALNMDQVQEHSPPPNPAKMSDSRAPAYVAEFGYSSWELDALSPATLAGLIRDAVESVRDDDLLKDVREREELEKTRIHEAADGLEGEE